MTEYISVADTAKLVRKVLKSSFPDVKFFVRSKSYSGGASININWLDGPTTKEVDAAVRIFESADFDGSIDLACYYDHWLLPDGTIQLAKGAGTAGSLGYIPSVDNPKPHPDAKKVHFGANYIHTNRAHSRELVEQVARKVSRETGWDIPEIQEFSWWVGGKERGTKYYHFKVTFAQLVPGSHTQALGEYYNRELWAYSGGKELNDVH